jgi:hypothetical protein
MTMSEEVRQGTGKFLRFAGPVGFLAKGFLYFCVGILIILSASGESEDESPQGVFKKIRGLPAGTGVAILSVLLAGLLLYSSWRLFEAFTGKGAEPGEGKWKRFFRHRLSPFVSACVYLSYAVFVIRLIFSIGSKPVCFPDCWRETVIGTVGLVLLGLAFAIAFVTQLLPALTGSFRKDMWSYRMNNHPYLARAFLVLGRIGFLGRAALFAVVSALFWAYVALPERAHGGESTISDSLDVLTGSVAGRVILMLIGIALTCYGIFAALNAHYKRFSTSDSSLS